MLKSIDQDILREILKYIESNELQNLFYSCKHLQPTILNSIDTYNGEYFIPIPLYKLFTANSKFRTFTLNLDFEYYNRCYPVYLNEILNLKSYVQLEKIEINLKPGHYIPSHIEYYRCANKFFKGLSVLLKSGKLSNLIELSILSLPDFSEWDFEYEFIEDFYPNLSTYSPKLKIMNILIPWGNMILSRIQVNRGPTNHAFLNQICWKNLISLDIGKIVEIVVGEYENSTGTRELYTEIIRHLNHEKFPNLHRIVMHLENDSVLLDFICILLNFSYRRTLDSLFTHQITDIVFGFNDEWLEEDHSNQFTTAQNWKDKLQNCMNSFHTNISDASNSLGILDLPILFQSLKNIEILSPIPSVYLLSIMGSAGADMSITSYVNSGEVLGRFLCNTWSDDKLRINKLKIHHEKCSIDSILEHKRDITLFECINKSICDFKFSNIIDLSLPITYVYYFDLFDSFNFIPIELKNLTNLTITNIGNVEDSYELITYAIQKLMLGFIFCGIPKNLKFLDFSVCSSVFWNFLYKDMKYFFHELLMEGEFCPIREYHEFYQLKSNEKQKFLTKVVIEILGKIERIRLVGHQLASLFQR